MIGAVVDRELISTDMNILFMLFVPRLWPMKLKIMDCLDYEFR